MFYEINSVLVHKIRLFVFSKGYAFFERNTRMGFNSKSRFGLALSSLGDINRDGFGGMSIIQLSYSTRKKCL